MCLCSSSNPSPQPSPHRMGRGRRNVHDSMKLCRFKDKQGKIQIGLVTEDQSVVALTPAGINDLHSVLESEDAITTLNETGWQELPRIPLTEVSLCAPLER